MKGLPLLILGNKIDLISNFQDTVTASYIASKLGMSLPAEPSENDQIRFQPSSAKLQIGVNEGLNWLVDRVKCNRGTVIRRQGWSL